MVVTFPSVRSTGLSRALPVAALPAAEVNIWLTALRAVPDKPRERADFLRPR